MATIIASQTITDLVSRAAASTRKRTNLNLHTELSDPTNRFLNAGLSGTYVQPHRHRLGRWELLTAIRGRLDFVIFTSDGMVIERIALSPGGSSLAEIPGGVWHSVVFHAPAAVALEVKPGPYEPELDKEFATWAPPEGDPAAAAFAQWLETAVPGERAQL
jgi:cupin fold WbuC family metalloprotein